MTCRPPRLLGRPTGRPGQPPRCPRCPLALPIDRRIGHRAGQPGARIRALLTGGFSSTTQNDCNSDPQPMTAPKYLDYETPIMRARKRWIAGNRRGMDG